MAATKTDYYPNIITNADVQGGEAVIRGTRLPVRAIAFYWRESGDRAQILKNYPQLAPGTLDEAIRYYETHRAEIDEELRAEAEVT